MEYVYISLILGAAAYYVADTIAKQWRKAVEAKVQTALKQEMLQRGMSADDIVKVMQAPNSEAPPRREPDLVGLAEQGIIGDGLARIQEAWGKAAARAPAEALGSAPDLVGLAEQGLMADDLIKVIQVWATTAAPAPPAPKPSTEIKASV